MYCKEHNRQVVGSCQWCGRQICKLDIGKSMGKKVFCRECSEELGSYIERRQMEQLRREKAEQERKKRYSRIIEGY